MNGHVHLKIGIGCLACVGFWPLNFESALLKRLYNLLFVFSMTVYVVFVSTQFIEMYLIINEDLEEISFLLGVVLLYVLGLVKVWVIGGADVKRLAQKVLKTEGHILRGDDKIALKVYKVYVGQNYAVNIIVICVAIVCVSMFDLTPFFTELVDPPMSLYDLIDNSTKVYKSRPLPLASWFPFDRYKHYKTSYAWHVTVLSTIPIYLVSCDNLFLGLIIFAVGQLKILQKQMKRVAKCRAKNLAELDEEVIAENLRKCVGYHKAIIKFVGELSKAMRIFLLLDFAACGFQMAVIGFQAAVAEISFHLLNTIVYLSTMLTQLFLFYWFGNQILLESQQVAKAIWESEWFLCNTGIKKSLLISMMRAQKPLTLTVGPFYSVSTASMMLVLRTGYSYAAIMRRLYSN